MPRFDGTGPNGEGALTGKGFGKCNENQNNSTEEFKGTGKGMGKGRRCGKGMGCGRGQGFGRKKES